MRVLRNMNFSRIALEGFSKLGHDKNKFNVSFQLTMKLFSILPQNLYPINTAHTLLKFD